MKTDFSKVKKGFASVRTGVQKTVRRYGKFRVLVGLAALAACTPLGRPARRALKSMHDEIVAEERARRDMKATLIDKQLTNSGAIMYFDMDGNPATTEGIIRQTLTNSRQFILIHDITNGTQKTVREWENQGFRRGVFQKFESHER